MPPLESQRLFKLAVFIFLCSSARLFPNCPNSTNELDWQKWQNCKIAELFQSKFDSDTAQEIQQELNGCEKTLTQLPKVLACTENVRRFTKAKGWESMTGHTLGASLSDEEYYSDVPYPEMLELPSIIAENQEFLKLIEDRPSPSNTNSFDKALAIIDKINTGISDPKLNWIPFIYDSQHLATPDGTQSMGRFFIYIPHPDYDRFIQFGIQRNPKLPIANSFSAVAVQKTDPATKQPLETPRARLKDFWRLRDESGKITISTRLKEVGGMENCYDCHKNTLLPIHPDPKTFDKNRFQPAVDKVNRIMRNFGKVIAEGYDHEGYGPGIGPETSSIRTDDFIRSCSRGAIQTKESIERVKNGMNCLRCHDGSSRGTLNFPSGLRRLPVPGTSVGDSMIAHYVVKHKLMPKGEENLTTTEREAIVRCLKAEYYEDFDHQPGLFKTWFQQKECWNSQR